MNNNIIIVLDLDNTLVHTVSKEVADKVGKPADLVFDGHYVFFRPFLAEFLAMVYNKYKKVGIWSFGTKGYVENVVKHFGIPFEFIYTIDNPPPGKKEYLYDSKELHYIDKAHNSISFIVDDRVYNTLHNLIRSVNIRPFNIDIEDDDSCLLAAFNTLNKKVSYYCYR